MSDKLLPATISTVPMRTVSDVKEVARCLALSGFFEDVKDAAKAFAKIQAGMELGIPPVASLTGIHLVQGKTTLGANLIAALIKRSGKYNYRINSHSDAGCAISFYENGNQVGIYEFSAKDAETAGLLGKDIWKKYRKAMLFNRALTAGARMHCPDIFLGPIYTAEELGAESNEEGQLIGTSQVYEGEIIDNLADSESPAGMPIEKPGIPVKGEVNAPAPKPNGNGGAKASPSTSAGNSSTSARTANAPSKAATATRPTETAPAKPASPSKEDKDALVAFAVEHGWDKAQLGKFVADQYGVTKEHPERFTFEVIEQTKAHISAQSGSVFDDATEGGAQ